MGYKGGVKSIYAAIGLEQEFFFVDREAYLKRPDLQFCGRTVMGKQPSRNQEVHDHYQAPISYASAPLACMKEIQSICFKLGKTNFS